MDTFGQFELSNGTLDAVTAKGYEAPTPIQSLAIGHLLEGHDLIAQAATGTGKTAAFGIPLIDNHRDETTTGIVALVLVPTRELAMQVTDELTALAKGSRLHVTAVYGGVGFGPQNHALQRRGATVLVATPGRLLDHLQRGTTDLDTVRTVILDEADRMLDMGFIRDVEKILAETPRDRQTALFSATLAPEIRRLADRHLHNPETVRVQNENRVVDTIKGHHLRVEKNDKQDRLMHLLHAETPERAIVFTRTKHLARRLAERLQKHGWGAVALQGNMSQSQRERAIATFRGGNARILVATDVAARGIDVPDVTHVVNYDLPDGADTYIHRVGRSARMGRSGRAFTFVQSDQVRDFKQIQRASGSDMPRHDLAQGPEGAPRGPDKAVVLAPVQSQRTQGGPRRSQNGNPRRRGNGSRARPGARRNGPRTQGPGGPRRGGGPRHGGGRGPRNGGGPRQGDGRGPRSVQGGPGRSS